MSFSTSRRRRRRSLVARTCSNKVQQDPRASQNSPWCLVSRGGEIPVPTKCSHINDPCTKLGTKSKLLFDTAEVPQNLIPPKSMKRCEKEMQNHAKPALVGGFSTKSAASCMTESRIRVMETPGFAGLSRAADTPPSPQFRHRKGLRSSSSSRQGLFERRTVSPAQSPRRQANPNGQSKLATHMTLLWRFTPTT